MLHSVIVGAVAGALAAMLSHAIGSRLRWSNRAKVALTTASFVLLFSVGKAVAKRFVGPTVEQRVATFIAADRLFQLLDRAEPDFRPRVRSFVALLDDGLSRDQAYAAGVAWGQEQIGPYVAKYLPRAADSSVIAFVQTFTEAGAFLAESDPRGCGVLFFGGGRTHASAPAVLPTSLQAKLHGSIVRVLEEGLSAPRPLVDTIVGSGLVSELLARVEAEHGQSTIDDLAQLAEPASALRQPDRACRATVAVYSTALSMGTDSAATVLRYLFLARE